MSPLTFTDYLKCLLRGLSMSTRDRVQKRINHLHRVRHDIRYGLHGLSLGRHEHWLEGWHCRIVRHDIVESSDKAVCMAFDEYYFLQCSHAAPGTAISLNRTWHSFYHYFERTQQKHFQCSIFLAHLGLCDKSQPAGKFVFHQRPLSLFLLLVCLGSTWPIVCASCEKADILSQARSLVRTKGCQEPANLDWFLSETKCQCRNKYYMFPRQALANCLHLSAFPS